MFWCTPNRVGRHIFVVVCLELPKLFVTSHVPIRVVFIVMCLCKLESLSSPKDFQNYVNDMLSSERNASCACKGESTL